MAAAASNLRQYGYALAALVLLTGVLADHYTTKHDRIAELREKAQQGASFTHDRLEAGRKDGASGNTLSNSSSRENYSATGASASRQVFWMQYKNTAGGAEHYTLYSVQLNATLADCAGLGIFKLDAPLVLKDHSRGAVDQPAGFPAIEKSACVRDPSGMYKFTK